MIDRKIYNKIYLNFFIRNYGCEILETLHYQM